MKFEELEALINQALEEIPSGNVELGEAEKFAQSLLKLRGMLAKEQLSLEFQRNKQSSVVDFLYMHAMKNAEGKNAPEKAANADANTDYSSAKETLANLNSQIAYLRQMADVFHNFHIFYRNIGKVSL